jgi:subtilisin family serine protease
LSARIECLEDRRVMSADPLMGLMPGLEHHALDEPPAVEHQLLDAPDFWIDPDDLGYYNDAFDQVDQFLTEAHNLTGWFNVQSNYGFAGLGQTVAVIDSGIAYDHFALGGGFGQGYRVVGGWDFTEENDANPYDDGPSGSHGTHVSGIIGSSSSTNTGVAPGVDLVALRVFNDAGQGFFNWIESALSWIHNNRNNFANPITAVNLSLGTASWNSATIPSWANLEDEFAQLEADGIFIAVSAGNAYGSYNTPGLSYPAASPYVVPVMSTNDAGVMSSYSQRLARAIAAPGQSIVSTVPDYSGNNNGAADDFASKSGTSMAAPYVAGASTLIRQAMEFVGMTGINQDMIYDHMMATADSFFDSVSNQTYKRLNLGRAIDALMPADDFGSTMETAYDLGVIADTASMSGVIGKLSDVDYFTFTAGVTGAVTFEANGVSQNMTPSWQVYGAAPLGGQSGPGTLAFEVVAGQTYTVSLSSTTGMGGYTIEATAEAAFSFTEWGSVAYKLVNDVPVAGETWYRVTATRDGFLTVQGLFDAAGGSVGVSLYDANLQLIAGGATNGGQARVDATAISGGEYFIRVTGANSDVDFKLVNLVNQTGSLVTAVGTSGDDAFTFIAGDSHVLEVNGVSYGFAGGSANQFNIDAGGGTDTLTVFGSSSDETFCLRVGSSQVTASAYNMSAANAEYVTAISGGGAGDKAILYDGVGNDIFEAWTDHAVMSDSGYTSTAQGFWQYYGYATAGNDRAIIYDTAGNDVYRTWSDRNLMTGVGYLAYASGFDQFEGRASTGMDKAIFYDSAGDDAFETWTDHAEMAGQGYLSTAYGFSQYYGYASTGNDRATVHDTAGNDVYKTWSDRILMTGDGYLAYASGFDQYEGRASTGMDKAILNDSVGDDAFEVWTDHAQMAGQGHLSLAYGFSQYYGYASAGADIAIIHDSDGDDVYRTWSDHVLMRGGDYLAYAAGFGEYEGHASTGNDLAILQDSIDDDVYETWYDRVQMSGQAYISRATGFDVSYAYASTGFDRALLHDSPGDDDYRAWSHRVMMKAGGSVAYAYNFDQTSAYATTGVDRAILYDSTGDDVFTSWSDRVLMEGEGYQSLVHGFRHNYAYGSTGYDRAVLYDTQGDDVLSIRTWGGSMTSGPRIVQALYFDELAAHAVNGGVNTANVAAVDYLFDLVGSWN